MYEGTAVMKQTNAMDDYAYICRHVRDQCYNFKIFLQNILAKRFYLKQTYIVYELN
jgi:hypothetical protein